MKKLTLWTTILVLFLSVTIATAEDGADPKTVTPAWMTEKELANKTQAQPQAQPQDDTQLANDFNVFFIGYDYPILSGALAPHLSSWNSPFNFSIGLESSNSADSSFLSGLELEFFITPNDQGLRFQMNDMVMLGYSFDIKPARLNLGARLGLGILDVSDNSSANPSYTALGGLAGPEAALYVKVAPDFWLWARGRYTMAYYFTIDSSGAANPIDAGDNTLNCLSFEAGLAFKM